MSDTYYQLRIIEHVSANAPTDKEQPWFGLHEVCFKNDQVDRYKPALMKEDTLEALVKQFKEPVVGDVIRLVEVPGFDPTYPRNGENYDDGISRHWSYRVVHHPAKEFEVNGTVFPGEEWLGLHEVHFENGVPKAFREQPTIMGDYDEGVEGLKQSLARMSGSLDKVIIPRSSFFPNGEKDEDKKVPPPNICDDIERVIEWAKRGLVVDCAPGTESEALVLESIKKVEDFAVNHLGDD